MLGIFIVTNLFIFLGYAFTSVFVAPNFKVRLLRTKIGGPLFFLTCGLTHLELAIHAWSGVPLDYSEFTSWHMLVIHSVQALAIWLFVGGLYVEFRDYDTGRWPHVGSD